MNSRPDKNQIGIDSIHYEGGNIVVDIELIENAKEKFKAVKLPLNKKLLGCNSFLRSEYSLHDFITITAKKTLADFSQNSESIDMVIFASANIAELSNNPDTVCQVLKTLNCEQAIPLAVTLQECTSMLAAIDVAQMYIRCSNYHNILVIGFDQIQDEGDRVKPFGVISDAVSSCIVSDTIESKFQILSYENGYDSKGANGLDDFNSRQVLSQRITDKVLSTSGATIDDVSKVFSTNFYSPVTKFNADALSIKKEQVYVDSALTMAHCVCSDPIINLSHFINNSELSPGAMYLLQSYAPGFMASMVIRAN